MSIHILKGTGSNCTCNDCSVLYGGSCYTTKDNNLLDRVEKQVTAYLEKTPTGRKRKVSEYHIDRCIDLFVRPVFCKRYRITKSQFYQGYYCFLPLVFLMTSNFKELARHSYRRVRWHEYNRARKEVLAEVSKKPA